MRSTVLLALLLCGLIVGGCSSSSSSAPSGHSNSSTPTASTAPNVTRKSIPDGTYAAVAVRSAELKKGLPVDIVDSILGPSGKITFTLKIQGGRWAQFQTTTAGVTELGDKGTLTYQGADRLTTVSTSSGAPGGIGRFRWSVAGHTLSLTFIDPASPDARLVMEHAFRKVA